MDLVDKLKSFHSMDLVDKDFPELESRQLEEDFLFQMANKKTYSDSPKSAAGKFCPTNR